MAGAGHGRGLGVAELVVFLLALCAGTACSLTSKMLLGMRSVGMTGEEEKFQKPLFQTTAMFFGMVSALFMHWAVISFKVPFPGYDHAALQRKTDYALMFLLIVPSLFDLCATALCMYGLPHVDVSIYQMLRGGAIVFVAILKHFALGDKLRGYMWIGVFWNVVGIIIVGGVAALNGSSDESGEESGAEENQKNPLLGVCLILLGALVQSLQYAFEEKVMTMENSAPPLLLIGMEGFWGSVVCFFVLYPVVYYIPGADHGSYENPHNTMALIWNSSSVFWMVVAYFFSIFFYNMLAVLVTYMLNSVWHAILDNFRPICVWISDLFIFYVITTSFGESWTVYSYLQLLGMLVLLYGTAVYNAPNAGSIKLQGRLVDCFLKFDYDDEERTPLMSDEDRDTSYRSPYISPMLSPGGTTPVERREEARSLLAGRGDKYGAIENGQRKRGLSMEE